MKKIITQSANPGAWGGRRLCATASVAVLSSCIGRFPESNLVRGGPPIKSPVFVTAALVIAAIER